MYQQACSLLPSMMNLVVSAWTFRVVTPKAIGRAIFAKACACWSQPAVRLFDQFTRLHLVVESTLSGLVLYSHPGLHRICHSSAFEILIKE